MQGANHLLIWSINGPQGTDRLFFKLLLYLLGVNANLGKHYLGGVEDVRPMLDFRRIIY